MFKHLRLYPFKVIGSSVNESVIIQQFKSSTEAIQFAKRYVAITDEGNPGWDYITVVESDSNDEVRKPKWLSELQREDGYMLSYRPLQSIWTPDEP